MFISDKYTRVRDVSKREEGSEREGGDRRRDEIRDSQIFF